jgi:hypothetical protein
MNDYASPYINVGHKAQKTSNTQVHKDIMSIYLFILLLLFDLYKYTKFIRFIII